MACPFLREGRARYCHAAPVRKLNEIVRAHQPHKMLTGKTAAQKPQCVDGELRAELRLDIADNNARVARELCGGAKAQLKTGHAAAGFQWILRANQPPDEIEFELPQSQFAGIEMTVMRGIE